MSHQKIYVYTDWQGEEPILMGTLSSDVVRGKEVFSFRYEEDWLKQFPHTALDPDLQLYKGPQYLNDEKPNFGVFLDSSPDRWGRMLIRRRESIEARLASRSARTLYETDYLLGIYDGTRMGALRFKTSLDGPFMDNNQKLSAPPWTSIRELAHASLQLEDDHAPDHTEYFKWLNMLIAPGSSLGGARPKANVVDEKGALWIAKFPSRYDAKNMGAWEKVIYDMAIACGITMAPCKAIQFNNHHHTFLTKRFDRDEGGKRLHFASAMTLLGQMDGADSTQGASYLSLVEFITRYGTNVDQNLEQLWRRIVFHIAVSNCDDHLRNHGFLLKTDGWELSPAYDINLDEYGTGLKLNISEDDNSLDFSLALEVADYFRISTQTANAILEEIKSVVSRWREYATKQGISRREQEEVESAFRF